MEDSKPKIDKIDIPKENLDVLNGIIDNSEGTESQISGKIRKIVGGVCTICHGIPKKKLTYQMHQAIRIEWYCDKCFNKEFGQIPSI